jgi:DGQHR domain-containing protein
MTTKKGWVSIPCFILKQGDGPRIAIAAIDAYDLKEMATVSRIADGRMGYQRIVNGRKVAAIARYVETPDSVLPTGIVLATGEKAGQLKVEDLTPVGPTNQIWSATLLVRKSSSYKPFLVIDGQHRMYGITESTKAPYPVPVTILLEASKLQQMANFEVINNRATRIAASHLNELRAAMYDLTQEETAELNNLLGYLGMRSLTAASIVSELNGTGMAFEEILDYPSNGKCGFVSSNTLVNNVERSRSEGFLKFADEEGDDQLIAYNALWLGIQEKFQSRWEEEVGGVKEYAKGNANKADARANLKLLHSGSLAVIGKIADRELASGAVRKRWQDDPDVIKELVVDEVFANVPNNFWDDKELEVDNTGKGRDRLRAQLEAAL